MNAGIIAAGEGSRLKSEGILLPKPLIQIDGVPLIERLIKSFKRANISKIFCIVNDSSIEVKRYVEQKGYGIPIHFIVRTTPSSLHSLFALAPYLKESRFLLSTVDSVFSGEELFRFLKHAASQASVDGLLAISTFDDDENPLYVQIDSSGIIRSFSKSDKSKWVTGGLYVFSPKIFNEINTALKKKIERLRNFLRYLLIKGYTLEAFPFSKIVDVDHIRDIHIAEEFLRV